MPRSPQDNEEIRAARREAIIAAATRVFIERGIARTKVKDIAEAADLSHGLLYHYFESKEAIFEALVDEMILQVERDLDNECDRAADCLRFAIARRLALLESCGIDASRVVMQAIVQGHVLSESVQARVHAHLQRVHDRVKGWIAQAQADGDLDDRLPPTDLTNMLLYLFRGMAIRWAPFPVPLPGIESIMTLISKPANAANTEGSR